MSEQPNCSVKCFGVGDGVPSADRNHAAFLYQLGQTTILVDCGEPVDASYKRSGARYDLVDAIFLSHLHADHFGGFFMLLQGFWLEGRRKDLPVYLPEYAIEPLRRMLEAALLFDDLLKFRLRLLPIPDEQPVTIGEARMTAFRTTHLDDIRKRVQNKPALDYAAYCFLIEAAGKRIGHSADLGKPNDLEPLLKKPLDLLVCEVAHFLPEQLFAYLKGRKIKQAAFVHLARHFWEKLPDVERLAAEMLPHLPHMFAQDFEEIRF